MDSVGSTTALGLIGYLGSLSPSEEAVFLLAFAMATARSQAYIPGMATIVQCNCGAEYRRTEEKFLVPHTGDAICAVCGAALESWSESTHVPIYDLIERPDRKLE